MIAEHAIAEADAERRILREMVYAALDQLHAAQQEIERQRRQIAEMREERARWARSVFGQ